MTDLFSHQDDCNSNPGEEQHHHATEPDPLSSRTSLLR